MKNRTNDHTPHTHDHSRRHFLKMGASVLGATVLASTQTGAMLDACNTLWTTQSENSAQSMPLGGGDIGLNVWVQNGQLLFYIARSGCFDENNQILKLGRVRISFTPNPFAQDQPFRQELKLRHGYVELQGTLPDGQPLLAKIWVEIHRPVIHVDIDAQSPLSIQATYESWRTEPREIPPGVENRFPCLNLWEYPGPVYTYPDEVRFDGQSILWYHRNRNDDLVVDKMIKQQGLEEVRDQIPNPLRNRTFGGLIDADNLAPAGTTSGQYAGTDFLAWTLKTNHPAPSHRLRIVLHTAQTETLDQWRCQLENIARQAHDQAQTAWHVHQDWWKNFWDRSHIFINPDKPDPSDPAWCVGRNYQLFRYMLACNAYGLYPTRFNGGLLTFDPAFVQVDGASQPFSQTNQTPDYRCWGEGSTAQAQRWCYWPLTVKSDSISRSILH